MIYLAIGLLLWILFHSMKRIFPLMRSRLSSVAGPNGSKGIIALGILISVVLIIFGYRMTGNSNIYVPPSFGTHINNLLMLAAIGFLVLGHGKSRLRRYVRHPMLVGLVLWAVAHLFANGDAASVLLFGLLGIWGVLLIFLINKAEPNYSIPDNLTLEGDVRWIILTLVIFSVIAYVHLWLGVNPFSS